jgi:plastocyanin
MMRRRAFTKGIGLGALAALGWPTPSLAGTTRGTVNGMVTVNIKRFRKLKPKSDHAGVVVYLEGVPGKLPKRSRVLEIRQIDKHFVPTVAVALVGTEISFPNDDMTEHNVYSNSGVVQFDLGTYKRGKTETVTVRKPGTMEVYCNIHHDMRATVLVLDTKHYAMTDAQGRFSIRNVAPGTYTYVAWQADGAPVRGEVVVTAGAETNLAISVVEAASSHRHVDKHGNPNGPY